MFKVLIVDDVVEMVQGLIHFINWESYGFKIVGHAYNGEEALEKAKKYQPELIITDIGMPYMDGLEFVRQYRKEYPGVKVIILSCHEDFKYAKEAIQINVDDYLIKDTLSEEELVEVIKKVGKLMLNEQSLISQYQTIENQLKANRILLESKFINDIIHKNYQDNEILSRSKSIDLKLKDGYYRIFYLLILDDTHDKKVNILGDQELLKFAIINIMDEVLAGIGEYTSVVIKDNVFMCFYWSDNYNILIYPKIEQALLEVTNQIKKIFLLNSCFAITQVHERLVDIKLSYKDIDLYLDSCFYTSESLIIKEIKKYNTVNVKDFFVSYKEPLKLAIEQESEQLVLQITHKIFNELIKMNASPKDAKLIIVNFIKRIELEAVQKGFSLQYPIKTLYTLNGYKELLVNIVSDFFERYREITRDKNLRVEVRDIRNIILQNLDEPITMEEIARKMNMNRSYLSRIFKNEMGISFTEYLKRKRIEKATEYLKNTDMTIEQITKKIGLEDVSYFYKMYKEYTNKTPGDVRNENI